MELFFCNLNKNKVFAAMCEEFTYMQTCRDLGKLLISLGLQGIIEHKTKKPQTFSVELGYRGVGLDYPGLSLIHFSKVYF